MDFETDYCYYLVVTGSPQNYYHSEIHVGSIGDVSQATVHVQ